MITMPSGIKKIEASDNATIANQNRNEDLLDAKITKLDGIAAGAGQADSATDTVIGSRTIDDTVVAAAGADTPTRLWSKLAYMIKSITGKASWFTAPAISLETVNTRLNQSVSTGSTPSVARLTLTQATGTSPLAVTSTTVNTNFNAEFVGGFRASQTATASTAIVRDASGRGKVAAPAAVDDIARKDTVDTAVAALKTQASITYYVNAATGNDGNDGATTGTALKTIQAAIDRIPQIVNHDVTVSLVAGTYNEAVVVSGFTGKGNIFLYGGVTSSTGFNVNSITVNRCGVYVFIRGINANSTTTTCFAVSRCLDVLLQYCSATTNAITQVGILVANSSITVKNCTTSGRYRGIYTSLSTVASDNNSGVSNEVGLYSDYGSTLIKIGTQPTGTTAEAAFNGGIIRA